LHDVARHVLRLIRLEFEVACVLRLGFLTPGRLRGRARRQNPHRVPPVAARIAPTPALRTYEASACGPWAAWNETGMNAAATKSRTKLSTTHLDGSLLGRSVGSLG